MFFNYSQKFFIVLVVVAAASADVSHLRQYLPPLQDSGLGGFSGGSGGFVGGSGGGGFGGGGFGGGAPTTQYLPPQQDFQYQAPQQQYIQPGKYPNFDFYFIKKMIFL